VALLVALGTGNLGLGADLEDDGELAVWAFALVLVRVCGQRLRLQPYDESCCALGADGGGGALGTAQGALETVSVLRVVARRTVERGCANG